jgi:integrase
MGIYKKGKVYWMIKQYNGRKVERTLDTSIKRVAEERYAKIVSDIVEGSYFNNQIKKRTLKEMIDRYQAEYTNYRSYYSRARDITTFKFLYKYLLRGNVKMGKKHSIEELGQLAGHFTLQDVENEIGGYDQWRKSQGIKPATILKDLGLLRRMFNIARKQWKWKMDNPVSDIELPKVNNCRVRYLDQDEQARLFEALDQIGEQWLKPFVTLAIETGLRLSNLCNLQWPEVNLFTKLITISAEKMKNRDNLGIPLTDVAYSTLRELQRVQSISHHVFHDNGEKLYYVKIQRAFRKALTLARIDNFHFHDLRHTFASKCVHAGIDLYAVQKLLGHKDGRMTQRYAHLSSDYLRDAISRLNKSTTILLQSEVKEGTKNAVSP